MSAQTIEPVSKRIEELRRTYPTEASIDHVLTRKMLKRADKAYDVKSLDEIARLLRRYLGKRLTGDFTLSNVRALTGGISKEQYRFTLHQTDAAAGDAGKDYILRLQPPEGIVETNCQREFEMIRAIASDVPVPPVLWCDAEGDEFPQPAVIMEFVPGWVKPPSGKAEVTGPKQGLNRRYRELIGPHFLKVIADIHLFDWRVADLPSFEIPAEGTNEAPIMQVNWWQRVWEEDRIEPIPVMNQVAQWLRDNAPIVDRLSVIHGDLRAGNFLFDPDTGAINAMLDWELCHFGDRHEDLAYLMGPLFSSLDENGTYLVNGIWEEEHFVREYEKLVGLPIDREKLHYYRILCGWRSSVTALGTAMRCVDGQKTHHDILLSWIVSTGFITLQEVLDGMAEGAKA